jgi:hypothetical protein
VTDGPHRPRLRMRIDVPEPFLRTRARRRLLLGLAGLAVTGSLMVIPWVLYVWNVWLVVPFLICAWLVARNAWIVVRFRECRASEADVPIHPYRVLWCSM